MTQKTKTLGLFVLLVVLGVVSLVICSGMFVLTNPKQLGPAMVTFWFIGFFLGLGCLLSLMGLSWNKIRYRKVDSSINRLIAPVRLGFLLSFCVAVLLALSSLHSLSLRDIVLFVFTVALIEFYFRTKRTTK